MTRATTTFKVINERNCPYYGVDDWFILNNRSVKVPDGLPSCLILIREFTNILFSMEPDDNPGNLSEKNGVFTCGGCTGLIKFQIDEMPGDLSRSLEVPPREKGKPKTEELQRKQKKSTVVVSGSLEEISTSELLQFFHMHQKTGKLLLDLPPGKARVAFREGAIIGARFGEQEDKKAIFSILEQNEGKFSFVSGIPESLMDVDDIGDFMMILMEGLKRLDEDDKES